LTVVSPLARIVANRGQMRYGEPVGLCVHTTGGGIVRKAIEAQIDPMARATEFYAHGGVYPHYLIGWDGAIVSLAPDDHMAAAAKWEPWEREAYRTGTWPRAWEHDGGVQVVPVGFYGWWHQRWEPRGFPSPWHIYRWSTGLLDPRDATPNRPWLHVEMLDNKPTFADAQVDALARLFVDRARAHQWLDPADVEPDALPTPWLLSHADLSPCRRSQAHPSPTREAGSYPFDPLLGQLDWRALGVRIVAVARGVSAVG
jgi:hypothetical protein